MSEQLTDMRIRYVIYFVDVDPDTGRVEQMLPVAEVAREHYANEIAKWFNETDEEPTRTYYYQRL